jgi:hypothetical protein
MLLGRKLLHEEREALWPRTRNALIRRANVRPDPTTNTAANIVKTPARPWKSRVIAAIPGAPFNVGLFEIAIRSGRFPLAGPNTYLVKSPKSYLADTAR